MLDGWLERGREREEGGRSGFSLATRGTSMVTFLGVVAYPNPDAAFDMQPVRP